MKKVALIVAIAVSGGQASASQSNVVDGRPCLSGVCVGDDLSKLRSIAWEPVTVGTLPAARLISIAEKAAPDSKEAAKDAAAWLSLRQFDAQGIDKLSKIRAMCEVAGGEMMLSGTFRSDGGHLTRVTASFFPSESVGDQQRLIVTGVFRRYEDFNRLQRDQQVEFSNALRERYKDVPPFRPLGKGPSWALAGGYLDLRFFPEHVERSAYPSVLRSYPGCGVSMALD